MRRKSGEYAYTKTDLLVCAIKHKKRDEIAFRCSPINVDIRPFDVYG